MATAKKTVLVPEVTEVRGLLMKLWAIMKSVERIHKDSYNEHNKYEYASEKAIKEVMHAELVDKKVLFKLDPCEMCMLETMDKSGVGRIAVLKSNYSFTDAETGEKITGTCISTGNGRDDKGCYAAITGAVKYIMTSTFLIPTGNDVEGDGHQPVPLSAMNITPAAASQSTVITPTQVISPAQEAATASFPNRIDTPEQAESAVTPQTQEPPPFGTPMPNDQLINAAAIDGITGAFAAYDVSREELEQRAGFNLNQFTVQMKDSLLAHYNMLYSGDWTKNEFLGIDG